MGKFRSLYWSCSWWRAWLIVQSSYHYTSNKLQQKWFWCNTVLVYALYNILKVASALMRGNWLFWPWKNQNVKIWPWNLIFKNVSLIVPCNILNWSVKCLRSSKCIYATQNIKFNLATIRGNTVITLYVSVSVYVTTHLYYSTIWSNVDGFLQNFEIVIPIYGILSFIASDIRYICQSRRNVKSIKFNSIYCQQQCRSTTYYMTGATKSHKYNEWNRTPILKA